TGQGAYIKAGLFENCALLMAQHIASYEFTGIPSKPLSMRKSQPWPVYDLFDVKNEQKIFIGLVTDGQWEKFCQEFKLDEMLADPNMQDNADRVAQREVILPILRELVAKYTLQDISERLDRVGCSFAPVSKPEDLIDDVHLNASEGMLPIKINGSPRKIPGLPLQFDGKRFTLRNQSPQVGEHSRESLYSVGFNEDQVNKMVLQGVLTESEH
ncbi:MAG: CoA transferase, partial [Crocinitomicaceae bacterium]|nr:CoA transferase [Crocinitomicaceae bacterium]